MAWRAAARCFSECGQPRSRNSARAFARFARAAARRARVTRKGLRRLYARFGRGGWALAGAGSGGKAGFGSDSPAGNSAEGFGGVAGGPWAYL